jgi:hypothetical protein
MGIALDATSAKREYPTVMVRISPGASSRSRADDCSLVFCVEQPVTSCATLSGVSEKTLEIGTTTFVTSVRPRKRFG